jgi:hypothetical protein
MLPQVSGSLLKLDCSLGLGTNSAARRIDNDRITGALYSNTPRRGSARSTASKYVHDAMLQHFSSKQDWQTGRAEGNTLKRVLARRSKCQPSMCTHYLVESINNHLWILRCSAFAIKGISVSCHCSQNTETESTNNRQYTPCYINMRRFFVTAQLPNTAIASDQPVMT